MAQNDNNKGDRKTIAAWEVSSLVAQKWFDNDADSSSIFLCVSSVVSEKARENLLTQFSLSFSRNKTIFCFCKGRQSKNPY